jgi:hypothetical protein
MVQGNAHESIEANRSAIFIESGLQSLADGGHRGQSVAVDPRQLPIYEIEDRIVEAAKASRSGKAAKTGIFVEDDTPITYAGPTDPDERWATPACVDCRAVRVQSARVMRYRPIYREWSCSVVVHFDDGTVDEATVTAWLQLAGRQTGIMEFRPACGGTFGRFEVC